MAAVPAWPRASVLPLLQRSPLWRRGQIGLKSKADMWTHQAGQAAYAKIPALHHAGRGDM